MSFASCIYLALELTSRHSAGDQNCSSRLSFSKEIVSWQQICRLLDTQCTPRGKARVWRFPQIGFRRAASLPNSLVLSWCPIGCLFVCFVFACCVLILPLLFWFCLFCFDWWQQQSTCSLSHCLRNPSLQKPPVPNRTESAFTRSFCHSKHFCTALHRAVLHIAASRHSVNRMLRWTIAGRLSLLTREWCHSWKHVQVSGSLRNSFTLIVSLWSRHPFLICKHSPPLHLSKSFATSVLRQHISFYSPLLLTMFLDALASLDFKLSVVKLSHFFLQLAHLRVFQIILYLLPWSASGAFVRIRRAHQG